MSFRVMSESENLKLGKASEEVLDAFYSIYCLKEDCYFDKGRYKLFENNHPIPKYCDSYGREYIIEKVRRVFKKK